VTYQFIDVVYTNDVMEVSIQRPEVLNALNIHKGLAGVAGFDLQPVGAGGCVA